MSITPIHQTRADRMMSIIPVDEKEFTDLLNNSPCSDYKTGDEIHASEDMVRVARFGVRYPNLNLRYAQFIKKHPSHDTRGELSADILEHMSRPEFAKRVRKIWIPMSRMCPKGMLLELPERNEFSIDEQLARLRSEVNDLRASLKSLKSIMVTGLDKITFDLGTGLEELESKQ